MEPGQISSALAARNPRVVAAARLHRIEERRERGLTVLEGPHLVGEAVAAGIPLVEILAVGGDEAAARWAAVSGTELVTVTDEALARVSSTRSPQSPLAVMAIPDRPLDPGRSVLVAWSISDPGNLGAMIRTAAAFGLDIATGPGTADPWAPKVLRAAAGGHFHTGVGEIRLDDVTTVAAVVAGGLSPERIPPGRVAILVGSEAHGLPKEIVDGADVKVTIPLSGKLESLNAAAAAAILCFVAAARIDC